MTIDDDIETPGLPLAQALDTLLAGAKGLIAQALAAVPAAERAALNTALDAGQCQLTVTMALPSGAVRVGVAGDWPGEKTLWSMTPSESVLTRPLNA